jgi:L,D-transpeptidase catalytic domain
VNAPHLLIRLPAGHPAGWPRWRPRWQSRWRPSRRLALGLALGLSSLGLGGAVLLGWLSSLGTAYADVGTRWTEGDGGAAAERTAQARRRLASLVPRGIHLEVDSYGGRLRVYDGETLLREGVCSAGSGSALRDPRDGRLWIFETPLGERRVERKAVDPVWSKPDWAFVEEGRLPPPARHPDRLDRISLGDYALYLGDGYLIHGTLFQTTLGSRVTHGCIRLGDEDLAWVYRTVPVGAKVWLY